MKIGHISDIHIDISATRLGKLRLYKGQNETYLNRLKLLSTIIDKLIDHRVDQIVVSGDLFDKSKPYPQEYYDLDAIFRKVKDILILEYGNHDEFTGRGCGLQPFEAMGYKVALDFTRFGGTLYFAPWGVPIKENLEGKILVLHAGVRTNEYSWVEIEGEVGNYTLDDLEALGCKAIMLGHHHNQCSLTKNIWYAGSPEVFNFGEENDNKGFLIWDIYGGSVEVTGLSTEGLYPKYKTFTPEKFLQYKNKGIDAFVRIKGEVSESDKQDIIKKVKDFDCLDYQLDLSIQHKNKRVLNLKGTSEEEILRNYLKAKNVENIPSIIKTHHEFD